MAYYPDVRGEESFLNHELGSHPFSVHIGPNDRLIYFCRVCEIEIFGRNEAMQHFDQMHYHSANMPPERMSRPGYGSGYDPPMHRESLRNSRHQPYPPRRPPSSAHDEHGESRYNEPAKDPYARRTYNDRPYDSRPNANFEDRRYSHGNSYENPGRFRGPDSERDFRRRPESEYKEPPKPIRDSFEPKVTMPDKAPIEMKAHQNTADIPEGKIPLKDSPVGALLEKLSQCAIKTAQDADLALNVASALLKFGKEYHMKKGDIKSFGLLVEAELKVGTANVLKSLKST